MLEGPRDILAPAGLALLVVACGLLWGPVAAIATMGAFMAALGVER